MTDEFVVEVLSATTSLKEEMAATRRDVARHALWTRLTLALTVVSVFLLATSVYTTRRSSEDRTRQTATAVVEARRVSCEQSNQVRQGMLSLADYIEQVSTAARPDATPEERAAIEARAAARQGTVDEMRRLNQLLDCSAPVEPTPKDG